LKSIGIKKAPNRRSFKILGSEGISHQNHRMLHFQEELPSHRTS
jgi:hypothetical protein